MSSAYFSITVINPQDWADFLQSQDTMPATFTYNPSGAQSPVLNVAANATLGQLFYQSDAGYPSDGAVNLIITVDTVDSSGKDHRETLLYSGKIIDGDLFKFDPSAYPVTTTLY